MSDYYNIIDSAEKIALEKGREIGREEGLLLAARNMLSQGMPVDIVMNVTGLSEDMVRNIHD